MLEHNTGLFILEIENMFRAFELKILKKSEAWEKVCFYSFFENNVSLYTVGGAVAYL